VRNLVTAQNGRPADKLCWYDCMFWREVVLDAVLEGCRENPVWWWSILLSLLHIIQRGWKERSIEHSSSGKELAIVRRCRGGGSKWAWSGLAWQADYVIYFLKCVKPSIPAPLLFCFWAGMSSSIPSSRRKEALDTIMVSGCFLIQRS